MAKNKPKNEHRLEAGMFEEKPFLRETETLRTLRILDEIEKNPELSQRALSQKLGVALGIINVCIHTLARKGHIKIKGENNRTLTYHLTHRGVLHKTRLAMQWTKNTINYYRHARRDVADKLQYLTKKGVKTAVLYGMGELTEIALIVAGEVGLTILGIIDDSGIDQKKMLGYTIGSIEEMAKEKPNAVLVCVEVPKEILSRVEELFYDGTRLYRLV